MSHHPSAYTNHHLPNVDHCALYMNENNGHQPYLIQNPPVNINMPTTPTVMLPNAVPQTHPASNPTIHQVSCYALIILYIFTLFHFIVINECVILLATT